MLRVTGGGGSNVTLLIQEGTEQGTGWAFLYEHVDLAAGVSVGSRVTKGQAIATSAIISGNNHFEMAFAFSNYEFFRDRICWVDQLEDGEKTSFNNLFINTLSVDATFISYWETNQREGTFPFKAFLDTSRFPDGVQLCYPQGTDVRE